MNKNNRKTEYFSTHCQIHNHQQNITKLKKERDEFIQNNKIEKVVDEDIKITGVSNNNTIIILKLVYY